MSPTYSSFWVGIDGYSSSTVEQVGTDSDCDGNNPTYYAWFEFYPNPSYEILGLKLSPGNKVSAVVSYNGSDFTVKITNGSTGQSYSTSQSVSGAARSSAEWIAEAPCCKRNGAFLPLADFGTVSFGVDSTAVNNTNYATEGAAAGTGGATTGPIGSFPTGSVQQINMVSSSGAVEDTTSSLSPDLTSFSVTWKSE